MTCFKNSEKNARDYVKKIYGVHLPTIPIKFDRLQPFSFTIAAFVEDGPYILIYRPNFLTKFFGYSTEEVLRHEFVHFGRKHFPNSFYEEIMAYRTSPSFFRRNFGPFLSSWYGIGFCLSLLFSFYAPSTGAALAGATLIATVREYWQLFRCVRALSYKIGNPWHRVYTLSPDQIRTNAVVD